jgi:nucleoside-diphosphate-sugar epimerase
MSSVLIIGARRGVGLGLVDVHLEAAWDVHATTGDGTAPIDHTRLTSYQLDVRDDRELEKLVDHLGAVDRIVHNAGIMRAARSDLMEVNTEAPIRIVETLLEAGTAAALIGTMSMVGGTLLAMIIERLLEDTVTPMSFGFLAYGLLMLTAVLYAAHNRNGTDTTDRRQPGLP